MSPKGCACNEKKKFPIQSLQEKMEKHSFNTINPENIAYVSTRMLPSAKNLGGIANFIQGNEAKSSIGKAQQAVKNLPKELKKLQEKDLKEHRDTAVKNDENEFRRRIAKFRNVQMEDRQEFRNKIDAFNKTRQQASSSVRPSSSSKPKAEKFKKHHKPSPSKDIFYTPPKKRAGSTSDTSIDPHKTSFERVITRVR